MSTFSLRIGTPDGLLFEGDVERVVCRSIGGDIAILARHCNFCTALGRADCQRWSYGSGIQDGICKIAESTGTPECKRISYLCRESQWLSLKFWVKA